MSRIRKPLPYVKRTITITRCIGQRVNDHGEFEDFDATLYDPELDIDRATSLCRHRYGDASITINKLEKDTHMYRIDFEDIVKLGRIVD